MGLLIEYHIPAKFPLQAPLPLPAEGAKVIEFQQVETDTVDGQPVFSGIRSTWIFVAPPR
jgi:hypothetical protein